MAARHYDHLAEGNTPAKVASTVTWATSGSRITERILAYHKGLEGSYGLTRVKPKANVVKISG